MNIAWGLFLLLLGLSSVIALWPLLRKVPPSLITGDTNANLDDNFIGDNVTMFEVQRQELVQELQNGTISNDVFTHREVELQRKLLTDVSKQRSQQKLKRSGKTVLLAVALLIPVSGWLSYTQLGALDGLHERDNLLITRAIIEQAETLEVLIEQLRPHLEATPQNAEGWVILANAYMQQEEYELALAGFEQALVHSPHASPQRADILGHFVQALFIIDGGFSDRVTSGIEAAIRADENNVSALSLLGIQAYTREDFIDALSYWQRALANTQDTQGQQYLRASIASAQSRIRAPTLVENDVSIAVELRLAAGLVVPKGVNSALFVYVRKPSQRMPILAAKISPKQLPTRLLLDNTMALQSDDLLMLGDRVEVVAHVSVDGMPGQKPGDLVATQKLVSVGTQQVIDLAIDQIVNTNN